MPRSIPMEYIDPDFERDDPEAELLQKGKLYEELQGSPGFAYLRQFLQGQRDSALSALRDNGDPTLEIPLLIRWREREAVMAAIDHELNSTIAMAKEIRNARRTERNSR